MHVALGGNIIYMALAFLHKAKVWNHGAPGTAKAT